MSAYLLKLFSCNSIEVLYSTYIIYLCIERGVEMKVKPTGV